MGGVSHHKHTMTHTVLWFQQDADGRFAIPHHCHTDFRFYHQVQTNRPYSVLNLRANFQIFLFVFTL